MRQASKRIPESAEKTVRDIRRATRRHHSAEEKIRIVLEGLRGEDRIEALEDGKPRPRRIWNKISDKIETAIVNLALEEPDLSPRELAVNFTDTKGSFV